MPALSRFAVIALVSSLIAVPAAPVHAQETEPLQRFQKAMEALFTGKAFEDMFKQLRDVQRRHALKAAGYNKDLPYYVPDSTVRPRQKPLALITPTPAAKPQRQAAVSSPRVRATQTALNEMGFNAGEPDGISGRQTAMAIERYQALIERPVTGKLTLEEREILLHAAEKKRKLAAVNEGRSVKGAKSYSVVEKKPAALSLPPSSTSRSDKATAAASSPSAAKPLPPLAPAQDAEGAKSSLPSFGDENSFDADDPEG